MSQIKRCFVSRWGPDGYIVEADYKQLEVVVSAFLSQDEKMIQDVLDGVDTHCMSASFLYNIPYEELFEKYSKGDADAAHKRKKAKAPSFQLQYGAGAKGMSKKTGIPLEQCKQFIKNYYSRYRQKKAWDDANIRTVEASRERTGNHTTNRYPQGKGTLVSPTGRRYIFLEEDAPKFMQDKGKITSFNPPQIKNYPVQGFAGGDLVPLVLGNMYHRLKNNSDLREKFLMINTVHDSIIFDAHSSVLHQGVEIVKDTMESAPFFLKNRFDIDFNLPLKIDVEVGRNWLEMETYEPNRRYSREGI